MPPPLSLSPLQWLGEVAISREFTMSSYFPRSLFKKHHQPAAARVRLRLLRCSHNRVHCLRNSERDSLPKKDRGCTTACPELSHSLYERRPWEKRREGETSLWKIPPHARLCECTPLLFSPSSLYECTPISSCVCV